MNGDKIMCVGVGLQEYYCVCAIIGLLKKKQSPEHPRYEEHKAAYRVTQMIQRVLSLQDNYSAAATLASLPNMPVSAPSGLLGNGHGNGNGNGIGLSAHMDSTAMLEDFGQDLEGIDLTNIAGWDLEAFWNF
ncbi:MAG: hypothetical protein ALECFALPRED_010811 [Alectoria fallacina]|uniref:Uncharacterized protein n=1 Tax=Alectoria fallacina TaxID=1903189 RepID=A0A8H3F602_9LECA|nr:MAG: hypothetical protein ALECFALPRED_010811 [Alectoria fallacina]